MILEGHERQMSRIYLTRPRLNVAYARAMKSKQPPGSAASSSSEWLSHPLPSLQYCAREDSTCPVGGRA